MRLSSIISLIFALCVFSLVTAASAAPPISEYTKAIDDSPADMKHRFYQLRANAYRNSGDPDSALNDLSTAIMLKPTYEAYKSRGEIYLDKKKYADAVTDFSAAIEMRPGTEIYALRGRAYLDSGNYVMALSDGAIIKEDEPGKSESYNLMIEACEKLGEIELGREAARMALEIDRTNAVANAFMVKYPPKIVLQGETASQGETRVYGSGTVSKEKTSGGGTAEREGYQVPEKIDRLKKAALGSGHHLSPGPVLSPDTHR